MDNLIPTEKEHLIRQEAKALESASNLILINNDDDLKNAAQFLATVKTRIMRMKELRDELVKPLKASVKGLDSWFKSQVQPFLTMEEKVKAMVGSYLDAQQKKALAEAKTQDAPVAKPATKIHTDAGRVNTAQIWKYEIEDLNQVPRQLLTLDTYKVRQAMNAGERNIPGIRIYQETQVKVSV